MALRPRAAAGAELLRSWRGPRSARLDAPGERVCGQWVPLTPDTVPLGTGHHLADLQLDEFQPVRPDLAVDLDLSLGDARRRAELLVEVDRSGRASSNYEKFRCYDALLNGLAMAFPRYKTLGELPVVLSSSRTTKGQSRSTGRRPDHERPGREMGSTRGGLTRLRAEADVPCCRTRRPPADASGTALAGTPALGPQGPYRGWSPQPGASGKRAPIRLPTVSAERGDADALTQERRRECWSLGNAGANL
jgi:hypothetical protein